MARVSSSVNALQKELVAPSPAPRAGQAPAGYSTRTASPIATPIPVKIIEGRNAIPQLLQETITAILSPLGTAALVLLLVIFMLLKREDLRGRMIRLIGQGRIGATTRAMEDAGYRVSRYLSMQFLVNACYGVCIAIGLYLIQVPNAALWGLLSGVLRFIPYIGPWAGAFLPVVLSFAISTSWFTPLLTIALFIVIGNNRVELCRAMGLRSAYRRVAGCFDYFGDVLDLVVGPRRPGTLYPHDRVFGCHRTACSATRIPQHLVK